MTVSSTLNKISSLGNGSTTAFSFPYRLNDQSHLVVTLTDTSTNVETVQTITTDYTVTLAADLSGATITFVTAPAVGKRVTRKRVVPYTQLVDYTESSVFPAETHEAALDALAMATQQLAEVDTRTLQMRATSTFASVPYVDDPVAGNIIGWDSTGTKLENKGAVPSSVSITSFLAAGNTSPSVAPTATGTDAFTIGNAGVSAGTRALAIGKAYASGTDSVAINVGNNTSTYGAQQTGAVAIGTQAKVTGAGSGGAVIGGQANTVTTTGYADIIVGGDSNTLTSGGNSNFDVGGSSNAVTTDGIGNGIIGGRSHTVTCDGVGAIIIGGDSNTINAASNTESVIIGGDSNTITDASDAVIVGGTGHNHGALKGAIIGGASHILGAAADRSAIIGGASHNITGSDSAALGGNANVISSTQGATVGGNGNTVSATAAVAMGTNAVASHYNEVAHASGKFATNGDAQVSQVIWRISTANGTPAEMFLDGSATRFLITSDATYMFDIMVVARRTDADNESAGYRLTGVIDNNAGTTALVGTVTKVAIAEDTAAWDVAATADNANDALVITVTGEAAKTIYWVADGRIVRVGG